MTEWILIFWIYLGHGGGVSNIPGFMHRNACENAGITLKKARPASDYICVPRNV